MDGRTALRPQPGDWVSFNLRREHGERKAGTNSSFDKYRAARTNDWTISNHLISSITGAQFLALVHYGTATRDLLQTIPVRQEGTARTTAMKAMPGDAVPAQAMSA